MKRYFIRLAYNGKRYHGWQIQENAHTVQAEINDRLSTLLGEPLNVVGCGRTDTGVHARVFYAHFDVEDMKLSEKDLCYKLDHFLPADIAVYDIFEVDPEHHARFSATSRTYRYCISRHKDPFAADFSYHYHGALEIGAMQLAAKDLIMKGDFTSFSRLHTQTKTNICQVTEAEWSQSGSMLMFSITADRFLRNMVRAIVGTLLEIGKGNLRAGDLSGIIAAKDRSRAGFSAPANGLALERINYKFLKD